MDLRSVVGGCCNWLTCQPRSIFLQHPPVQGSPCVDQLFPTLKKHFLASVVWPPSTRLIALGRLQTDCWRHSVAGPALSSLEKMTPPATADVGGAAPHAEGGGQLGTVATKAFIRLDLYVLPRTRAYSRVLCPALV